MWLMLQRKFRQKKMVRDLKESHYYSKFLTQLTQFQKTLFNKSMYFLLFEDTWAK